MGACSQACTGMIESSGGGLEIFKGQSLVFLINARYSKLNFYKAGQ